MTFRLIRFREIKQAFSQANVTERHGCACYNPWLESDNLREREDTSGQESMVIMSIRGQIDSRPEEFLSERSSFISGRYGATTIVNEDDDPEVDEDEEEDDLAEEDEEDDELDEEDEDDEDEKDDWEFVEEDDAEDEDDEDDEDEDDEEEDEEKEDEDS